MAAKHPIQRAVELLERAEQNVVIVGDISRTRYEDITDLRNLVEMLSAYQCVVRCAAQLPFDSYTEEAAIVYGVRLEVVGPRTQQERLHTPKRSASILNGAHLVIALPGDDDPLSADPMVLTALEMDIPVLAMWRAHKFKWITKESYGYA